MRRTEKALTGEPDYRAHIKNADVEYFNPPDYLASRDRQAPQALYSG